MLLIIPQDSIGTSQRLSISVLQYYYICRCKIKKEKMELCLFFIFIRVDNFLNAQKLTFL